MNIIDLMTGYAVAAFPNFESAFAATEELCGLGYRVAYLNEVSFMRESEVKKFVVKYELKHQCYYHNYHNTGKRDMKTKATESIKTALELLEQNNNMEAKFIVVLVPKKAKTGKASEGQAAGRTAMASAN